jgi:hypothetical protein
MEQGSKIWNREEKVGFPNTTHSRYVILQPHHEPTQLYLTAAIAFEVT